MKLKSILQVVKCSHCRCAVPLLEHKRMLNFTEGETTLFCKNCHRRIGVILFPEWNRLQREKFEHPELAEQEARKASPRQDSENGRGRGRGRDRGRRGEQERGGRNQAPMREQASNRGQASQKAADPNRPAAEGKREGEQARGGRRRRRRR